MFEGIVRDCGEIGNGAGDACGANARGVDSWSAAGWHEDGRADAFGVGVSVVVDGVGFKSGCESAKGGGTGGYFSACLREEEIGDCNGGEDCNNCHHDQKLD